MTGTRNGLLADVLCNMADVLCTWPMSSVHGRCPLYMADGVVTLYPFPHSKGVEEELSTLSTKLRTAKQLYVSVMCEP